MPTTVRLSRRFYDTFGDENTNELVGLLNAMDSTYIGELRALNETNFARFDAKLEQRVAELRGEFNVGLAAQSAELRGEFNVGFAALRTESAELRGEFKAGIAGMRADVLKWIVGLWLVTMLGIASLFAQIAGLR